MSSIIKVGTIYKVHGFSRDPNNTNIQYWFLKEITDDDLIFDVCYTYKNNTHVLIPNHVFDRTPDNIAWFTSREIVNSKEGSQLKLRYFI